MNCLSGRKVLTLHVNMAVLLALSISVLMQSKSVGAIPFQQEGEPDRCVVGFVGKPSSIMSSSFIKDSGFLPTNRENPESFLMTEAESVRGVMSLPSDFEEFSRQGPGSTDYYIEFTFKKNSEDTRYFKHMEKTGERVPGDGKAVIFEVGGIQDYQVIFDGKKITLATTAFEYNPKKLPALTGRLEKLLDENSKADGFLAFDAKSARTFLDSASEFGSNNLPPMAKPYFEMLSKIEAVVVSLEIDEIAFIKGRLECERSQDAKDAVRLVDELVEMAKQNSQGNTPNNMMAKRILDSVKVSNSGSDVEISMEIDEMATRQSKLAATEMSTMNNQRQAVISFHNFHDAYGRFPFLAGEQQSNELSWRVRVLPFLDQAELFKEFDLSQPWDSPKNRKTLEEMPMPAIFGDSGNKTNMAWIESDVQTFRDITRGTSNTIAFIQSDKYVHWTENNNVTPEQVIAQFKALKEGEYLIASFYDGSIRKISRDTDLEEFSAMLKPNDDE